MKVSHRSALSAAGLAAALAVSAIPSVLGAQMRPQGPGPDTKRAVVTTFRGEPDAGVKLANEIRNRIQTRLQHPPAHAGVQEGHRQHAGGVRLSAGFGPQPERHQGAREARPRRRGHRRHGDARPAPATASTRGSSCRATSPCRSRCISVESANLGDVAKQIVREYEQARKQIPSVQECEDAPARPEGGRRRRRRPKGHAAPTRARPSRGSASPTPIRPGRTGPTRRPSRGRTRCSP